MKEMSVRKREKETENMSMMSTRAVWVCTVQKHRVQEQKKLKQNNLLK